MSLISRYSTTKSHYDFFQMENGETKVVKSGKESIIAHIALKDHLPYSLHAESPTAALSRLFESGYKPNFKGGIFRINPQLKGKTFKEQILFQIHLPGIFDFPPTNKFNICNKQSKENTLSQAVAMGAPIETLRILIEDGGAIPCNEQSEFNTLTIACNYLCPLEVLEFLLHHKAKPCTAQEHETHIQNTLSAALNAQYPDSTETKVIQLLIDNGAKPCNLPSLNSLYYAMKKKHCRKLVYLLITAEALPSNEHDALRYPDHTHGVFNTLNHCLDANCSFKVMKMLAKRAGAKPFNDGISALTLAVAVSQKAPFKVLQFLKNTGAKIPDNDPRSSSYIMTSAIENKYSFNSLQLLAEAGARLGKNDDGYMLTLAARHQYPYKVYELLLQIGLRPCNKKKGSDNTLIQAVICGRSCQILELLIQNDAKIINDEKYYPNSTLITAARYHRSVKVFQLLSMCGAQIDNPKIPILTVAIEYKCSAKVIKFLLNSGATLQDDILTSAARFQRPLKIFQLLINAGAKPSGAKLMQPHSTLFIAREKRLSQDIIQLLIDNAAV